MNNIMLKILLQKMVFLQKIMVSRDFWVGDCGLKIFYLVKKLKSLNKLFDNVIIMFHIFHIIQNIIIQISTIAIFDKKPEFIIHQISRRKFAFQNALNNEISTSRVMSG